MLNRYLISGPTWSGWKKIPFGETEALSGHWLAVLSLDGHKTAIYGGCTVTLDEKHIALHKKLLALKAVQELIERRLNGDDTDVR